MKKLLQILATAILGAGLMAGVASADSVTCGNISNTGPNSNNTITCVDTNNVDVTCNNSNQVVEVNNQTSSTGNAFTVDNTYSGSATSGSSSNGSTSTVNLGDSCAPVAAAVTTTPTVTPTATPTTPAVTPAPTTSTVAPVAVKSLPGTGSNTVLKDTAISASILGGTMVVSQLGVIAYRRLFV